MAQLKRILLVDDDDDLREALAEQLMLTEDFDVFEGGNGAEGMEQVKAGLFDLVILDVGLDRKSTRLNSSHRCISYAVFCLKKKKKST